MRIIIPCPEPPWAEAVVQLVRRRGVAALGVVTSPGAAGEEVPRGWDASLAEEVALALAMSAPAAGKLVDLAVALATRLDATAAALDRGEVDYVKRQCEFCGGDVRHGATQAHDWNGVHIQRVP